MNIACNVFLVVWSLPDNHHTAVAELTRAMDVALLCLPGTAAVSKALVGNNGVLIGFRSGQLVVDCSTGDPSRSAELVAQVAEYGGHYLDAPATRTPEDAVLGRLNVLAGSKPRCWRVLRDHLSPGTARFGHKTKVTHNFISQGNTTTLAEASARRQRTRSTWPTSRKSAA